MLNFSEVYDFKILSGNCRQLNHTFSRIIWRQQFNCDEISSEFKHKAIQNSLTVSYKDYQKLDLGFLSNYIIAVNFEKIDFSFNYQSQIMKQICTISFFNLKRLDLSGNNIENIESISWIQMFQIQSIILSNNKIISLEPLRKTHFNKLRCLAINNNPANFLVSRMKWDRDQKNSNYWLESSNIQPPTVQDTAFLLKMENSFMRKLYIQSSSRIPQSRITKALEQKYVGICIQYR